MQTASNVSLPATGLIAVALVSSSFCPSSIYKMRWMKQMICANLIQNIKQFPDERQSIDGYVIESNGKFETVL